MKAIRLYVVSLGCPKNLIDTELMLGQSASAGMELADDPRKADVILVNTCGFLQEAREEALDVIFELAALDPPVMAVTGCLVERYREEIQREIPEIDILLGVTGQERFVELVTEALDRQRKKKRQGPVFPRRIDVMPGGRFLTTPPHTAYLRIAEGCDLACSFCVIPQIRGPQKDRSIEEIVGEARELVNCGAKELSLIAQDTPRYGTEKYGNPCLPTLLEKLNEIDGLRWVRVLYANPLGVSPELVRTMRDCDKVLKYLDMPIQHVSNRILKAMRRGETRETLIEKTSLLRSEIPEIALRTTVMVGFPGETEAEFRELTAFLTEIEFEHVGVFAFSREEGTPAAELPDQVDEETITKRHLEILHHLDKLARTMMARRLDTTAEAIVDGPSEIYPDFMKGRIWTQGLEVDGVTYIRGDDIEIGEIIPVKLIDYKDQDFFAERI